MSTQTNDIARITTEVAYGTAYVTVGNAIAALTFVPSAPAVSAAIFGGCSYLIYKLTHLAAGHLLPQDFYLSIVRTVAAFATAIVGSLVIANALSAPIALSIAVLMTASVVLTGALAAIAYYTVMYCREAGFNASAAGFESWIQKQV